VAPARAAARRSARGGWPEALMRNPVDFDLPKNLIRLFRRRSPAMYGRCAAAAKKTPIGGCENCGQRRLSGGAQGSWMLN